MGCSRPAEVQNETLSCMVLFVLISVSRKSHVFVSRSSRSASAT